MEVGDALVEIANKLGIAVEEVYRIFVEAQRWVALATLAQVIVVFLMVLGPVLIIWKRAEVEDGTYKYSICGMEFEEGYEDFLFTLFMVGAVMFFISMPILFTLKDIILRLAVPEYVAIQDLFEALSGIG